MIEIYEDIWFQVEYEVQDITLNFVATKIAALIDGEPPELETEPMLKGFVKWDGCMNVEMQQGYVHFCGRLQTDQYAALFGKIYDKAIEVGCQD